MSKLLVLGALAALSIMPTLATADNPLAPAATAQAVAADQSATADADDTSKAKPYCVTQTGSHIRHRDGSCLDGINGQSVTRYEWEQAGGLSASDYLGKGIP